MKNFFTHLLSKDGNISSKILFGIIMLIQAIVYSYIKAPAAEVTNVINSFLLAGEILLGVSIASDVASKIAGKVSNTKD